MKNQYLRLLILILFSLVCRLSNAQNSEENFEGKFYKIGFNYGFGSVDNGIYNDNDYLYNVQFRKIQIYYRIKTSNWSWDILLQPEYNTSHHRLDNPYFIGINHPNMSYYRSKKKMHEYILNIGVLVKKDLSNIWSAYGLLSVGPGYHDTFTERMEKGFGFSDNIAFGVNYKFTKRWIGDLRFGYRHVSNGDIALPNEGYDTLNLELGMALVIL